MDERNISGRRTGRETSGRHGLEGASPREGGEAFEMLTLIAGKGACEVICDDLQIAPARYPSFHIRVFLGTCSERLEWGVVDWERWSVCSSSDGLLDSLFFSSNLFLEEMQFHSLSIRVCGPSSATFSANFLGGGEVVVVARHHQLSNGSQQKFHD